MRRFLRLLLLTMVCFSLAACNQKQDQKETPLKEQQEQPNQEDQMIEENQGKSTDDVTTTNQTPPKKSIIITEKFERQVLNDKGDIVLLMGEFKYPQVENQNSAASVDKLNEEIKSSTEEQFVKSFTEGNDYVKEFYGNEGANSSQLPFVTEQKFDVTHNQDYIISFRITSYSDFGGAHPNVMQSSYTYDVRTGEKLPASHFVGGTDQEVKELVGQSFYTVVIEQPEEFYPNASDILSKGQFEFDFYINGDAITFFINPYIIAPHAAGIQEVSILLQ